MVCFLSSTPIAQWTNFWLVIVMAENLPKEMSRRDFLRLSARAGSLAFLMELGFSKNVFAQLEKVFKGREFITKNFDEGLRLLREKVWDAKEHFWIYVAKGDRGGWIDAAEQATDSGVTSIALEPLLRDKTVTKIHLAHTHPPIGYDPQKPRKSVPAIPSDHDIMVAAYNKAYARMSKYPLERLRFSVLDSTGIWHYDPDPDHDAIRPTVMQYMEEKKPVILNNSLHQYLLERQEKINEAETVSPEHLKELQIVLSRDYGVELEYKKYS